MKKFSTLLKTLLVGLFACGAMSAWAQEWSTVWTADFSSAPSGMTYSVSNGSVDISTGVLFYHQGGGSGNRAINTAFTADAFGVDTNWQMEFDWGASSSNTNASNVAFATNNGVAFTITWDKYATAATITDGSNTELTTTLPIDGYNKATMTNLSHFIITGDTENGIYLTVTNGETTYIDNILVASTFGYPATFNGSLGRAVSHMALDNIAFKTPFVAGFVPAPTASVTGVDGTARKFTLSCTDPDAALYYSETELSADASGWSEYTSETKTEAATIYAIAKKGSDVSDVFSFETGAGTVIQLNAPNIFPSALEANGNVFVASFNATNDQASVMFSPSATMTATFTDENGTSDITLPFKPTTDGTITVTATADGYETASASLSVAPQYIQSWISTDFSTLTDENAVSTLGDGWAVIEGTGRWSSWTAEKEPYTYYQYTEEGVSVPNVTVESNLRIRNVTILNLGYGLSRNISGSEDIKFLNTTEGTIVAIKVYNGYGGDISDSNTYMDYRLNYGNGDPLFGCNNTRVLVQASYYIPASVTATIGSNGYATFASKYAVDFSETGLKAYKAAISDDGERVNFTEVTGAVRANTGLLIEGTANESYTIPVVASGEGISGNDFKVNTSGSTFSPAENTTYFAMVKDSDPLTFGTVNPETVAIPANKAYLAVTNASASRMTVTFNSETTGIKTIESSTDTKAIYNLNGQRIKKTQKGLYIMNGKKAIVK